MDALVVDGNDVWSMARLARPAPGAGELLLKVELAGLCGSDFHLRHSAAAGSMLGHEFVGMVSELGTGVEGFVRGDRVCSVPAIGCGHCVECLGGDPIHCRQARMVGSGDNGAFSEYVRVGAQWSVRVPASVSTEHAALVEPFAVGLKLLDAASIRPGETLLVIGAGPTGIAVTAWAHATGVGRVLVSDPSAERRSHAMIANALGVVDPETEDLLDRCREVLGSRPDVIIECAGIPGIFESSVNLVGDRGRIVLASLHSQPETFHRLNPLRKEVTVLFPNFTDYRVFTHTREDGPRSSRRQFIRDIDHCVARSRQARRWQGSGCHQGSGAARHLRSPVPCALAGARAQI